MCIALGLLVDPSVFYEHGGYFPAFQYGTEFLRPFLSRPGGPSQYAAAYLAQSCAYRWLGAGVLTALAVVLGWGYGLIVRQTMGKPAFGRGPGLVLAAVLVWTRYGLHLESITALALAVLIAAAYAHPRLDSLRPAWRAGVAISLVVLGYWLCGGAAFVGVLLSAAVEHQRRRRPGLSALLLLAGILTPAVLGHLVLDRPLREAVTCLLPYSDTSRLEGSLCLCLLYGLAVVPAIAVFLWRRGPAGEGRAGRRSGLALRLGWVRLPPRWRAAVGVLAAAALIGLAWPPQTARRLAVMKHCRAREWELVLAHAARLHRDRFTLDVSYAVNLALYHTGRLGDAMFAFPQAPLSLNLGTAFASCPEPRYYAERPKAIFDIGLANLEMGLVNEAERLAHEGLEVHGPHPAILQQLVLVNLVKRRPEAARIVLGALCQNPVARPWARARAATLVRAPEELLNDEFIIGLRENLPTRRDESALLVTLEARCLGQLEENPGNRMAFEYLMAHYLLTHNLDGFLRALPRAQAFNDGALPTHYQEAVVLCEARTGQEVPPWSAQVRPEVREQFRQFAAAVAPYRNQPDPVPALAATRAFVKTYFHHYAFERTE